MQETVPAEQSSGPRLGIGFKAAFLLHQSIYSVAALIAVVGIEWGRPAVFQDTLTSLLWLTAWIGGARFFWKRRKPQVRDWILPFFLSIVYWFLAAPFFPDGEWGLFGFAMFVITGILWILAFLVRKTGFVLGDGHQQKELIRRWISNFIPAFGRYHDAPPDFLGRISSPPQTSSELPWQPSSLTTDAYSQPLLPNGLPREPSETE